MTNLKKMASKIDWPLLREQKEYCLNEVDNNNEAMDVYLGLVHLIDALQDAAVADGVATEKKVFG